MQVLLNWNWLNKTRARLFRYMSNEPLPIQTAHRRIFVLPTRAGMMFGITLLAMLLAATNYGISLTFLLSFWLISASLIALVQSFKNLLASRFVSISAKPVFCGEAVLFELSVQNPTASPKYGLRLLARSTDQTLHCSDHTRNITAHGQAQLQLSLPTKQRGLIELQRLYIESDYPLGLIIAWTVISPRAQCLVYPRPEHNAPELPLRYSEEQNAGQSKRSGDDELAELRSYQPGDSPKKIAWRLAARNDQWFSKMLEQEEGDDIVLDFDAIDSQSRELKLSRLCRWVIMAEGSNLRYQLQLGSWRSGFDKGQSHYHQCLQALALYPSSDED